MKIFVLIASFFMISVTESGKFLYSQIVYAQAFFELQRQNGIVREEILLHKAKQNSERYTHKSV